MFEGRGGSQYHGVAGRSGAFATEKIVAAANSRGKIYGAGYDGEGLLELDLKAYSDLLLSVLKGITLYSSHDGDFSFAHKRVANRTAYIQGVR